MSSCLRCQGLDEKLCRMTSATCGCSWLDGSNLLDYVSQSIARFETIQLGFYQSFGRHDVLSWVSMTSMWKIWHHKLDNCDIFILELSQKIMTIRLLRKVLSYALPPTASMASGFLSKSVISDLQAGAFTGSWRWSPRTSLDKAIWKDSQPFLEGSLLMVASFNWMVFKSKCSSGGGLGSHCLTPRPSTSQSDFQSWWVWVPKSNMLYTGAGCGEFP